ncbi:hypothetical protein B0H14DRAFT_2630705 [Mycena olivaceomarginata]|nr:hypothetical protein B0H14DRAFT_2630705 [Mycena olivaceomarginata]
MSAPLHSIEDIIPFIFYNTPNDSSVGTDALLDGSGNIDYQLPPYRLTDADVAPTPGRPLLTVSPFERGPSRVQVEGDSWPPFHFFSHPAIYRLMPFVRIPARIRRTDPLYLATILDRAVPVFTRGKSKKDELLPYVPPRPVPTMDTVRLAAESLAKEQSEPTVFDAGCSNCVFRNRDCAHGVPGTLCDHCKKGRLSHCTHTFTVPEHVQAANYIEPYARLSNQHLSAARADYELARESLFRASSRLAVTSNRVGAWIREVTASLGADGLPGMDEIPEELQPLWGQLLLDSQAQLSIDYRAAILQYPFLSDTRRSGSTSDDELQGLLDILARRAARNHQSTPPPVESSNWPEEDEAESSGSR